jgi:hypothetical protein
MDPHQIERYDSDPHQYDTLDQSLDPHQFADYESKCMEYRMSLLEHFFSRFCAFTLKLGFGSGSA